MKGKKKEIVKMATAYVEPSSTCLTLNKIKESPSSEFP